MAQDVPSSTSGQHPAAVDRISAAGDFKLDRGVIALTTMAIVVFTLTALTVASFAQTRSLDLPTLKVEGRATIGGKPADPCVGVDVAGRKAGSEDCAAQKLQDAAKAAQDHTDQGRDTANLPTATSHDTYIGVANQTATKQRLGNNFGKSVLPQRPNTPPPAPTPFSRQN